MDEDCVIVEVHSSEAGKKPESTEKGSGSAKKLKQTLLCFKAVDPNLAIPSVTNNTQPSKKRRLSDVATFSKSAKNAKKANSGTIKRKSVGNGVDEGDKEVSSSCEMEGVQPATEAGVHAVRPGNSSDLLMKFIHTAQQVEVSTTSSKDGEMAAEVVPENENEPTSTGDNKDWVSQDEASAENKENIPDDSEECEQQMVPHSSVVSSDVTSKVLSDADIGEGASVDEDANQVTTATDVVKSVVADINTIRKVTSEEGDGNCAILVQTTDNCTVVDENADMSVVSDDPDAEHTAVHDDAPKSVSINSSAEKECAEKEFAVEEDALNGTTADESAIERATVEEKSTSIEGDADNMVPHTGNATAAEKDQIASSSDIEKVVSGESSEVVVEEELDSDDGKSGEQDLSRSSASEEAVSCQFTGSSSNQESSRSEEKAIVLNEKVSEKSTLKGKTKHPKVPFPSTKKQKEEQQEKEFIAKKKCKEERQQQKKERQEQKERERQEAKMQKEKERLEKEKEKEDKKRQKEEERQKKQEQQEEEKKKKEEARLEEKKRKEEEKKKKEEEKQDKEKVSQKEKQLMQNFFFKTSKDINTAVQQNEVVHTGPFMPFEPKRNMRLAPKSRVDISTLTDRLADLDSLMASQSSTLLYIDSLKTNVTRRGKSGKTWPREEMLTGDVVVVEALNASTMKAKLFQFSENYRPAYYGTWQKQSQLISGRRPFAKDTNHLDYEVDSDDEWEEVEPGESLSHSEGEDETEPDAEPDDDEDGSFMVPHGYLSEGEGCEDEDDVRATPDELKACQLAKARNWDAAINTKQRFEALRPICIGICWWTPNAATDSSKLKEYEAVLFDSMPITLPDISSCSSSQDENKPFRNKHMKQKGKEKGITYIPVPEAAIPDLIRLVHGNEWSIFKVVKEFQEFWRFKNASSEMSRCKVNEEAGSAREPDGEDSENLTLISKRKLDAKIRQIAIYERRPSIFHKRCWYVCSDSLEKHGLTGLHVPNQWKWITKLPNKSRRKSEQVASAGEIQEKPVQLNHSRPDSAILPSMAGTACASAGNDKTELVTSESLLKTITKETEAENTISKKTAMNSGMKKHCVKRLGKKKSAINSSSIHCFIAGAAGQSKITSLGLTKMLKSTSATSNDALKPKTITNHELFKNPIVLLKRLKSAAVTNPVAPVLLSSGTQLDVIRSTGNLGLPSPKRPSDGCVPEPKRQNLKEVCDDDDCIVVDVEKKSSSSLVPTPESMKESTQNTSN